MAGSNNDGWCLYVLKCRNNYLYIGVTNNLERRVKEHADGKGSKFVRSWRPFEIVRVIPCKDGREARSMEYQLKKMKRSKKMEVLRISAEKIYRTYTGEEIVSMERANAVLNRVKYIQMEGIR